MQELINGDNISRITEKSDNVGFYLHHSKHLLLEQYAPGVDVLDVGSGSGLGLKKLSHLYKSGMGIDYNSNAVEYANSQNVPNTEYIQGDVRNFDLGKKFDLIYSMDVIEHLDNVDGYLQSIRRHMKTDGYFICATPNIKFTKHTNPNHVFEYTVDEFKNKMNEYYTIEEYYGQEKNDKSGLLRFFWSIDIFQLRKKIPASWGVLFRRLMGIPLYDELSEKHYPLTKNYGRAYALIIVAKLKEDERYE
jgi:SAM-dependent methyltransferase